MCTFNLQFLQFLLQVPRYLVLLAKIGERQLWRRLQARQGSSVGVCDMDSAFRSDCYMDGHVNVLVIPSQSLILEFWLLTHLRIGRIVRVF